jgi:hypothetical protein
MAIQPYPYTVWVAKCDSCGRQNRSVADGFGTASQATSNALANGWHIRDDDFLAPVLCPDCAQEPCS